jgi:hypothetical protein
MMLRDLCDMPVEARIYIFVASRPLTADEEREVLALFDAWLTLWSVTNQCAASTTTAQWDGQVLYFAIDERSREARGVHGGLSGSDLDWLYGPLSTLESQFTPPIEVTPGIAVIADGQCLPLALAWRKRYAATQFTAAMQIIKPCAVADWRTDRFVRRLGDDEWAVEAFLNGRINTSHLPSAI